MKEVKVIQLIGISFILSLFSILLSVSLFPNNASLMSLLVISMILSFYFFHIQNKYAAAFSFRLHKSLTSSTYFFIGKTLFSYSIGIILAIVGISFFFTEKTMVSFFSIPYNMIFFEPLVTQAFYNKILLISIGVLTAIFYNFGGIMLVVLSSFLLASLFSFAIHQNTLLLSFQSVITAFGVHGIFEILAYMLSGYISFLLYIAISKFHISSKKFAFVLNKILLLVSVVILLVVISAAIEVLF